MGQAALFRFGTDTYPPTATGRPASIAVDAQGTVYVIDTCNNCIRAIRPDGNTSTLVGQGVSGDFIGQVLPSEVSKSTDRFFAFCGFSWQQRPMQIDDDGMLWLLHVGDRQLVTVTTVSKSPNSPAGVGTLVSSPFDFSDGTTSVDWIAVDSRNRSIAFLGASMLRISPVRQVAGVCAAGYFCPPGSVQAKGSGQCLAGYQCPAGSSAATGAPLSGACLAGTFSNAGSSACLKCIRGFYTPGIGASFCFWSDELNDLS
jgi:hypothetical protein